MSYEQHYLQLLKDIKSKGTYKAAARANMPGTYSLFGYQIRHDLSEGFPLLTTKKVNFKHIVTELLWFMRGDTNVKYLVDNGCNIWNEDAYNYYLKVCKQQGLDPVFNYTEFVNVIKDETEDLSSHYLKDYKFGDCGKQYGWLWRSWEKFNVEIVNDGFFDTLQYSTATSVDQLQELINGLKSNPLGRRHIITAWNPATLNDMALNACHSFVQWNCRPLSIEERLKLYGIEKINTTDTGYYEHSYAQLKVDEANIPKYYLDCQMYQRSADVFLGVPYNAASYSLLTEILAKVCNMIPGDFIHTFGDVHIYESHVDAVNEQLTREPGEMPTLKINIDLKDFTADGLEHLLISDFAVEGYNPQSSIKAELSTGLIK